MIVNPPKYAEGTNVITSKLVGLLATSVSRYNRANHVSPPVRRVVKVVNYLETSALAVSEEPFKLL